MRLIEAHTKTEVTNALTDARARHTFVGCHVSAERDRISWVSYRIPGGEVERLTFYPDLP
jgi:hypothetical protein